MLLVLWEELKDIFYGCLFILENVEKFLGWINPNPVQVPVFSCLSKKDCLKVHKNEVRDTV